jgi:chromate transporter
MKVGLLSFGGGYCMIGILKEEVVNNKKWMSIDEFIEIVAIAEMTPGPIAINMATYVGKKTNGFLGSVFATTGVILPSFTIILLIAIFSNHFFKLKLVKSFIAGILVAIVAQIAKVGITFLKTLKINSLTLIILILSFFGSILLKISTFYIILIAGLISLIIKMVFPKC